MSCLRGKGDLSEIPARGDFRSPESNLLLSSEFSFFGILVFKKKLEILAFGKGCVCLHLCLCLFLVFVCGSMGVYVCAMCLLVQVKRNVEGSRALKWTMSHTC